MNRVETIGRIAHDLRTAEDAARGRRLVLQSDGAGAGESWGLGYALPRYTGAWEPGAPPSAWVVLEWLADASGPLRWPSLDPAAAAALALREEVLDAGPGPVLGELLVVVAGAPRVVVV